MKRKYFQCSIFIIAMIMALISSEVYSSDTSESLSSVEVGSENMGTLSFAEGMDNILELHLDEHENRTIRGVQQYGEKSKLPKKYVKPKPQKAPETPPLPALSASCFITASQILTRQKTPEYNRDVFRILSEAVNLLITDDACRADMVKRIFTIPTVKAPLDAQCKFVQEVFESGIQTAAAYTRKRIQLPLEGMVCPISCPDLYGTMGQLEFLILLGEAKKYCKSIISCDKNYDKVSGSLTESDRLALASSVIDSVTDTEVGLATQLFYYYLSDDSMGDDFVNNLLDRFQCCLDGSSANICQLYFERPEKKDCLSMKSSQDPIFKGLQKNDLQYLRLLNSLRCKFNKHACSDKVPCKTDNDCRNSNVCGEYGKYDSDCKPRCLDVCSPKSNIHQLVECTITGKGSCGKMCVRTLKSCETAKPKDANFLGREALSSLLNKETTEVDPNKQI